MADLLLFYGGTFDPVHDGHLAIARAARDALHAPVRMMPAADPPHRPPPGATAEHRLAMLRLAIGAEPGLCLDPRELERGGRSYSIETLQALRAEVGPKVPVALLVGADSFLDLPNWKSWRALFDLAHFVVARRSGSPLQAVLPDALAAQLAGREATAPDQLLQTASGRVFHLHQPLQPESASEIRRRIAQGQPWRAALPPAVADYIVAHGLYGAASARTAAPGGVKGH